MKSTKKVRSSRKRRSRAARVAGLTAATGILSAPLFGGGTAMANPPEELIDEAICLTNGDHTALALQRSACDMEAEALGYRAAFLRPCNEHNDAWCTECEEGREWLCFGVPDENMGKVTKKKKATKKKATRKKKASRKKATKKKAQRKKL